MRLLDQVVTRARPLSRRAGGHAEPADSSSQLAVLGRARRHLPPHAREVRIEQFARRLGLEDALRNAPLRQLLEGVGNVGQDVVDLGAVLAEEPHPVRLRLDLAEAAGVENVPDGVGLVGAQARYGSAVTPHHGPLEELVHRGQ